MKVFKTVLVFFVCFVFGSALFGGYGALLGLALAFFLTKRKKEKPPKLKANGKAKAKKAEPEEGEALERLRSRVYTEEADRVVYARYFYKAHTKDYTAFDTETTGVLPAESRIIEIAACRVRGGEIVDTFQTLVNPGVPVPKAATAVNHITTAMLKGAPDTRAALASFFAFAGDDILAAHNGEAFDLPLLWAEAERCGLPAPQNRIFDTLWAARIYYKGPANYKLGTLCEWIGHKQSAAHRALDDAKSVVALTEAIRDEYRLNPER